jgi:hypothetical protein
MSSRKLEQIECTCGEQFEAELWTSINITEDPELKESLDAGEINVVCCPACSQVFHVDHFLLYHDSKNELLAFVYPTGLTDQEKQLTKKMNADIDTALEGLPPEERFSYRPILVFGLDALLEIIRREDELEDELSIVEFMAEESHLAVVRLHPAIARRTGMLRILPTVPVPGETPRACVLAGLRDLLKLNENLSHFRSALDRIEQDPRWTLTGEMIIDQ